MEKRITRLIGLIVIIGAIASSGCARIKLFNNENFVGPEVGIKFYYPKPYLLVARTGAKDNPVQISVVYLPDQSKPTYAKFKTGYGSAELSLALQNGILTNIGQKTDTKIPETMTALSGMATSAAGMLTAVKAVPQAAPSYQAQSNQLQSIADGLSRVINMARDLTNNEKAMGSTAINLIRQASRGLAAPEPNLAIAIGYLKNAIDNLKPLTAGQTTTRITIQQYSGEVQGIIDSLYPKQAEPLTFELYEIDNSSGKTVLRKVEGGKF